mmetsp:Transcript_95144/g.275066  ORF Transcript_95144/g.275066 Transcript_95144/m.275066 type:complete len:230 (+) Transcript_95144:205-894(+)
MPETQLVTTRCPGVWPFSQCCGQRLRCGLLGPLALLMLHLRRGVRRPTRRPIAGQGAPAEGRYPDRPLQLLAPLHAQPASLQLREPRRDGLFPLLLVGFALQAQPPHHRRDTLPLVEDIQQPVAVGGLPIRQQGLVAGPQTAFGDILEDRLLHPLKCNCLATAQRRSGRLLLGVLGEQLVECIGGEAHTMGHLRDTHGAQRGRGDAEHILGAEARARAEDPKLEPAFGP